MSTPSDRFQFTERDLLVALSRDVKHLTDQLKETHRETDQELRGLHIRVRILENFRWWILGGAAAFGFLGALLGGLIHR